MRVPAEQFATEFWSRQPLLTPVADSGADFTDLLSPAAVDELLSERGLRTPFIRMAKQGSVIPARQFTRSGGLGAGVTDQVADDKVLSLMADGSTLVLQALHRNWPPLVDFGTTLAHELGHPVQINAYLTPPENQGFAPHYDTHDVFVLQVSGRKRWVIHEPVRPAPLPGQDWEKYRAEVTARAAEPPLLDTVLEPGDALYLPRGYIHSAVAQATAQHDTSIHLTVGVHPLTRYAVLQHLLAEAADDPSLRTSLPMATDLGSEAGLAAPLAETVSALTDYLAQSRLPEVAARMAGQLSNATRPAPLRPLAQLAVLAELNPGTRLVLRPGLRPRLERTGSGLRLHAIDQLISLDVETEPALKLILSGAPVQVDQLPGLTPAAAVEFARRLLTAGVLVPGA